MEPDETDPTATGTASTRRRFLGAAATAGVLAGLGAPALGQDDESGGEATTIELGAEVSGWQGRAPADVEGATNPTLSLQAGERYRVEVVNLDGVEHTFDVLDADGGVLVTEDVPAEEGATVAVEFEAAPAMANYRCAVHPDTMFGQVEVAGEAAEDGERTAFAVRIENVSTAETLRPPEGEPQPVPLSPGVYAVHTAPAPLFAPGEPDRAQGLEAIAEDGDPSALAETLGMVMETTQSGTFTTPVGAEEPGPIGPGGAYEFTVRARPAERLSFATMFVPSNDLFFAPDETGIALFGDDGQPVDGDVTDQVLLWDAGTEVNEQPGTGPNQVQRQSGPDTGPDENAPVRPISEVDDGFEYPDVADVIRVTISPEAAPATATPTDNETADNETVEPADNETVEPASNETAETTETPANETTETAGNETTGGTADGEAGDGGGTDDGDGGGADDGDGGGADDGDGGGADDGYYGPGQP